MTEHQCVAESARYKSRNFRGGPEIPREYVQAERRLVAEWAAQNYPRALKMFNVRVGSGSPTLADSGMSLEQWRSSVGLLRRFVDVLIVLDTEILSVEAKIAAKPDAIGQLLLYAQLIPHTPEIADIATTPVRSALLCAIEDPAVTLMARQQGIDVFVYHPDWVDEYLATKAHRKRESPLLDSALVDTTEGDQ